MNTPVQRSFAGKRSKMTAADVRRHVMTGSLLHPTSFDTIDGATTHQLSLIDVVEPCDVEEALAQRKTSAFYDISSSTTSPRKVSEFPADDVEVRVVPRESYTVDPPVSKAVEQSAIDPHVRDIIASFSDPFSLVQKRYQQFGSADAYVRMMMERPMIVSSTARPLFEADAARADRVARSASVVVDGFSAHQENIPKRHSYASTASTGTMGSGDGETREPRLHHSQPDPTIPGAIQRVSFAQLDQLNDVRRQSGRQTNLVNLLPLQAETDVLEKRSLPPYPDDRCGQKLTLKVVQLVAEPYFEPIFGSIAIFDAKARRKVTENFYFDVNAEQMRAMLQRNCDDPQPFGRCNQAVFSLNCPLNDLYMVVKLDKVLQACDMSEAAEPYMTSSGKTDEKWREKLQATATEYCGRLGHYRMPFGFMVVDLQKVLAGGAASTVAGGDRTEVMTASIFTTASGNTMCGDGAPLAESESIVSADRVSISSSSTFRRVGSGHSAATVLNRVRTPLQKRRFLGGGSNDDASAAVSLAESAPELSLSNLQALTLNLNSFFKQEQERMTDEDLFKLLADARKSGGKLSRLKTFPMNLSLQLSGSTGDELLTRLSSDMLRVAPFSEGPDSQLTKEIHEFSAKGQYAVNTSYRNLLFVYPRSVNLSSRQGTARNISVRVELMNGKETAQPVVFPRGAGSRLTTHATTSVLYHCKAPQMSDEIKLRIPVELDDGYHLRFTFYHVSCKTAAKEEEFEYPIGYSWLPLYREGRLSSGDFSLPICLERPPPSYGYLMPEGALPNIKWLDNHRPLFNITIQAVSTVHPQDEHLERFLLAVSSLSSTDRRRPPVSEATLITAIQGILKSRPEPMVSFLYNVLDKLLSLISHPPYTGAVSSACFETAGQLVKICTMLLDSCLDSHGRSSLLISYIHYFKIAMKESTSASQLCKDMSSNDKNKPGSPETQKLFHIIEDMERSSTASLPSEAVPISQNKAVHEELAELWVRSGGQAREMAFLNSWFFLELMMKSMAEYLSMTGRLYLVRRSRFGERYVKSIDSLSAAMAAEVCSRVSKDCRQASAMANSWAFFLRDSFSLMDRSYVMTLVKDFNQALSVKISCSTDPLSASLMLLKLDFLRIVSSHEHFVILNLPFGSSSFGGMTSSGSASSFGFNAALPPPSQLQPSSPGAGSLSSRSTSASTDSWGSLGTGELSAEFRRSHFLVGLVLADLAAVLETSGNSLLHSRAIGVIRNLLATHEADSRLMDGTVAARVASLYLPLLTIVMDAGEQIHGASGNTGTKGSERNGGFPSQPPGGALSPTSSVDPKIALAIAGMGSGPSPPGSPGAERAGGRQAAGSGNLGCRRAKLSLELSRQLISCFCWVLKHIDSAGLRHWLRDLTPTRLAQLIQVLQLAVTCFDYRPNGNRQVVVLDSGSLISSEADDSSVTSSDAVRKESRGGGDGGAVKWRRGGPAAAGAIKNDSRRNTQLLLEDEQLLDACLCTEISLCVLDVVETVVRVVSTPGCDHLLFSLPLVLRLLMHMLASNQSVQALESVFASQRALIVKYPELVFEQDTEQCGELCLQLLRHCASRLPALRSQAAVSLYLLMRESFESGSSLARVKMQITMCLSTLVSNGTRKGMWLNEECLRRCLKTVLIYAETDANTDAHIRANASFSEQVKDLVFNLHMILSDTVKMKEYANDFEMTLDLMYRIAKGYQNNPDLRLTWLLNMSSMHTERGLYCEASQCMLHAAALAAEYIAMTTTDGFMPRGAVDFLTISENVLEESAVSDDVVSPEVDGICESRHFTSAGLVHLVEQCSILLEKALMYELLPDLFKVIEPILREWRDFRRLSSMHARLSDALSRIEPTVAVVEDTADAWVSPLRSSDKRCFGTYFRVGFYGLRFGDLDGEEFIYKEAPFTKLSEISHRLESFYTDRFGKGVVEVIKDSNNVVRSSQDASRAYLQVTYVEPLFDKWERRRRPTHFERSHTLKRFVYATPFTRDGKAHGDLKDQFKRRTILTTQHSFPYVKTRIRVVDREQKVLQPIQVAIEDVEKKTRELSAAISQRSDAKMLQMVLQGCIGTTVNQGPVQVATVFLTDVSVNEAGKPVDRLQNKLRLAFRDFSKKCADALTLNKQLIQPDQLAYQNELQKNYAEFTRRMAPILGGTVKTPAARDPPATPAASSTTTTSMKTALERATEIGPVTAV